MTINEDFFDEIDDLEIEHNDDSIYMGYDNYPFTLIIQSSTLNIDRFKKCMDSYMKIKCSEISKIETAGNYMMKFKSEMETVRDVIDFIIYILKGCRYDSDLQFGLRYEDNPPFVFKNILKFKEIITNPINYKEDSDDTHNIIFPLQKLSSILLNRDIVYIEILSALNIVNTRLYTYQSNVYQYSIETPANTWMNGVDTYDKEYLNQEIEKRFYSTTKLIDNFIKYFNTNFNTEYYNTEVYCVAVFENYVLRYSGDKITQSSLYKKFISHNKLFIIDNILIKLYYKKQTKLWILFIPFYFTVSENTKKINELMLQIIWSEPDGKYTSLYKMMNRYIDIIKIKTTSNDNK